MRNESEMMQLICDFANHDERIRAVLLNGSRANPIAPKDLFQDYDIVYVVDSVNDFVHDQSWISYFGDILIMQTPDKMDNPEAEQFDEFAYLMLFTDGNRIDLTWYQIDHLDHFVHESQTIVLIDKDGRFGHLPPPSNRDYLPLPPTDVHYYHCCNEFWWVSTYVAKGLWRQQLPYAMRMYEGPVRDMLMRMLTWYIGVSMNFQVETGKEGKYFERYLEPPQWDAFVRTFAAGDYERIWQALFEMGRLFRETALTVAKHFGYTYPIEEDRQVTDYLQLVHQLPPNAKEIG